jgi:hypothetical protein
MRNAFACDQQTKVWMRRTDGIQVGRLFLRETVRAAKWRDWRAGSFVEPLLRGNTLNASQTSLTQRPPVRKRVRHFDLNIEKILEGWEKRHAIRELIANAVDEQALTRSGEIKIERRRQSCWCVRDFGRGVKYQHLTQNENQEKLRNFEKVIGKLGVAREGSRRSIRCRGASVSDIQAAQNVEAQTFAQTSQNPGDC